MIEALIQKIEEWFMRAVLPVLLNILLWLMRITLLWAFITMMGLAYNEASRAITEWIGSIS
tara:strand:- start:500 stop:682 length:183 start_codon:yes stop_codon:yes gene_type:complete